MDYGHDVPECMVQRGLALLDSSVSRAADLAALLDAVPADTLRAALSQLLPARHPGAQGNATKAALVSALQGAAPPERIVTIVRGLTGPLLRLSPSVHGLFARMQRLYFLAEGQDISA